jgi:predicted RNA-binding protein
MRYWIGVVTKAHVELGVREGIMQLGHGKRAPLARLSKGDWLIYYSPVANFGDKTPVQAFTALGQVADDEIYQHTRGEDLVLYRRKVKYIPVHEASIRPLIDGLDFITSKQSWGYVFRFGLVEIQERDFLRIRNAMTE